jgi:hypothetical protein
MLRQLLLLIAFLSLMFLVEYLLIRATVNSSWLMVALHYTMIILMALFGFLMLFTRKLPYQ